MSDPPKIYLLDTSSLIEAKNHYYAFDIAQCFWDSIVAHSLSERILLIDQVFDETQEHKDELAQWVIDNLKTRTASTDNAPCTAKYDEIVNWVNSQKRFKQAHISRFLGKADPWLIAYAKINGAVVVTREKPEPTSTKVKIPDVCNAFQVQYTNTFDMLRELGVCWK